MNLHSPPYPLPWTADGYAGPCLCLGRSLKPQREPSYIHRCLNMYAAWKGDRLMEHKARFEAGLVPGYDVQQDQQR